MTVVIHEFEVVAGPVQTSSQQQDAAPSNAEKVAHTLTPREIERIIRRHAERQARLWAH